jgi:predicted Zn finger-like uncharacterized protein
MSLATRCNACGTVFRVVQDQLKVSEGWVRCGRCGEVFNALEGLFDLEGNSGPVPLAREPVAPPLPTTSPHSSSAMAFDAGAPAAPSPVQPPTPAFEPAFAPSFHAEPAPPHTPPHAPPHTTDTPAAEADFDGVAWNDADPIGATPDTVGTAGDTLADSRVESSFDRSTPASSDYTLDLIDSQVPDEALVVTDLPAEPAPSFLREEARTAQWQRPRVRRALAVLALLLTVILGMQVAVQQRDELAARWPAAAPMLQSACSLLGCEIDAPRVLEALAVESSGLTRVDGAPQYRLQVVLRNRATTAVLAPAFDLTLTDLRGDVVARRVLVASDFGSQAPRRLAPGEDWSALAVLDLGDTRVAGYTVELFYP